MVRKSKKAQRDANSEGLTGSTGSTGSAPVESGLSGGSIAGIVIVVVLALVLLLLYILYYLKCVKAEACIGEDIHQNFTVPKNFFEFLRGKYTLPSKPAYGDNVGNIIYSDYNVGGGSV